jgi:hypothetical protein
MVINLKNEHALVALICVAIGAMTGGPVAVLVGIEGGVVSGVINLESPDVGASGRRPRHENRYHDA